MLHQNRKYFVFLGMVLLASTSLWAADLSGDNLNLTGDADIQGANLYLGTGASSDPGITWHYADGTTATITLSSSRNAINWEWYHNSGSGTQISMKLDSGNQLILYNATGSAAGITLNPTGTSAFANGITIGGSAVLTSAAAASTYLTPAAGDTAYLRKNASHIAVGSDSIASGTGAVALGGAEATGDYSFATTRYSQASGYMSVAMIQDATAVGEYSFAINGGYAEGDNSVAIIAGWSSGYGSVAVLGSVAEGDYSLAMAQGWTTGYSAIALGEGAKAQAMNQVVVGTYNVAQGNGSSVVPTDDLFIVGNGTYTTPSNAFVVKKNGNTKVSGNLEVVGAIRVPPQGDISMGEFTAGP
jgi:hypothetical protein